MRGHSCKQCESIFFFHKIINRHYVNEVTLTGQNLSGIEISDFRSTREPILVTKVGFVTSVGTYLVENRPWIITNPNIVVNTIMSALSVIVALIGNSIF